MIEVKIPKDIKNYKDKFIMNLTVRQFISFALSVFIMLPIFTVGVYKYNWSTDAVSWGVLLIGFPVISIGFINFKGMNFEKFILQYIKTEMYYPQKRIYRTRNELKELIDYVEPTDKKRKKRNDKGSKEQINNSSDNSRYNSVPSDII